MNIGYIMADRGIDLSKNEGCNIHIIKILDGLREHGDTVELITYDDDIKNIKYQYEQKSVKKTNWLKKTTKMCLKFIKPISNHLSIIFTLNTIINNIIIYRKCMSNKIDFDILHERYGLYSIAGVLASKKLKIPLVLEVNAPLIEEQKLHNVNLGLVKRWLAKHTSKICFKWSSSIFVVSNELKRHLITKWNIDSKKIYVLPNAADVESFRRKFDKDYLKTKYKVCSEKSSVVIFIGSMKVWHGVDLLVDSFKIVLKEVPNAILMLVGDGDIKDDIEGKIKEYNIGKSVIMTGNIPHESIKEVLSIADVAVTPYPNLKTGFYFSPIKLFEYMAAGKAIVASDLGQISEVIKNNQTGILVEPENINQLSDAIIKLLKDDCLRSTIGMNAQNEAIIKYSWERYIQELIKIYDPLIMQYSD